MKFTWEGQRVVWRSLTEKGRLPPKQEKLRQGKKAKLLGTN